MRAGGLDGLTRHGVDGSVWWRPRELAQRWAAFSREQGMQAVGAIARMGDRLAAVEDPSNRLPQVVTQALEQRRQQRAEGLARWLVKGAMVDADA